MIHLYKMSQMSQDVLGNTRPKRAIRKTRQRSRKWCLTINNYSSEELSQCLSVLEQYIVGKEKGADGTPHLQVYCEFKNQVDFSKMKRLFPRAHIEKALGSRKHNLEYCKKEGDYVTNMEKISMRQQLRNKVLEKYNDVVWKNWQQELLDILKVEPDDRTIHWFWETAGNVGKSFFARYVILTRKTVICEGKKGDVFNQINSMIDSDVQPEVVIVDIPRVSLDFVSYSAIEQCKNGVMYSGKYEGGQCVFPPPHVICFANKLPDLEKLSRDRWNIVEIGGS